MAPNKQLKLFLIFLTLLLDPVYSKAQFRKALKIKESKNHSQFELASTAPVDTVELSFKITSLVIQIEEGDEFSNSFIVAGKDTFNIAEDAHQQPGDEDKFSNLIIFDKPVSSFIFNKGAIDGKINYHFINTGDTPKIYLNHNKRIQEDCGKPATIDQAQWRQGLTPPTGTPAQTNVKHVIVHHSAGSNTNTNYTYVVRQIYVFHTEVRNYSDVGYNFLVAQNGTVYEGREGSGADEEDAIGAHFCAKNSQTMGICLLGDYEIATPTSEALSSLIQLTSWKLKKENLDPFSASLHPPNNSSAYNLGVIAGHRDGCETDCPGKNLYSRLDEIRQKVKESMEMIYPAPAPPVAVNNSRTGPGVVKLESRGGTEGSYRWFTTKDTRDSIQGEHNSTFTTPFLFETTSYFVAIHRGSCLSELVQVTAEVTLDRHHIFPNPASETVTVILKNPSTVSSISLTNSLGQSVLSFPFSASVKKLTFNVSGFASGVYILNLLSSGSSERSTLIIQ